MKLYTRTDASSVINDDHEGSPFNVESDGSITVPDTLGEYLHNLHFNGKPAWENDAERHTRLVGEEASRRADPATLLAAVEALGEKVNAQTSGEKPTVAQLRELADARRAAAAAQEEADNEAIAAAEAEEVAAAENQSEPQTPAVDAPHEIDITIPDVTDESGDGEGLVENVDGTPSTDLVPAGDKYREHTVAELTEILKSRDLPTAGNKADLVARLVEDDGKTAPAVTAE